MRYIVWDLETTGLNPYHDQIIEIAAVDNYGRKFESLVCLEGGRTLSAKVKELTGITEEMLRGKPALNTVLQEFLLFIKGADYMIGHNSIRFDYLFLKSALKNHQMTIITDVKQLDTMLIYQCVYPGISSYALITLCKCFSVPHERAHRAMGDVSVTQRLFERILRVRDLTCEGLYGMI